MNVSRALGSVRVVLLVLLLLAAGAAHAGTFLVTSTADNGAGTFRQGILDANAGTCTSPCTISFDATTFATTQTISLSLPNLIVTANNVSIDGFSGGTIGSMNTGAFGSADNSVQRVVINGPSNTCCSITVSGSSFSMRGMVIQDFQNALVLQGTGALITGCKFGTDATGTTSGAGVNVGTGIQVTSSGTATIGGISPAERNIIGGAFLGGGIDLQSAGNLVIGNYIGANAAGTGSVANNKGIVISANNNTIGNAARGNVVSGNTSGKGVEVTAGTGTTINNNRIGTTANGSAALANTVGIAIGGGSLPGSVSIGASTPNLISGNTGFAIDINTSSGANTISANYIGLNITGTAPVPNNFAIYLSTSGTGNTISSNVIAGNSAIGIAVNGATNLTINNNEIGVRSGTPFGNASHGIQLIAITGTTTIFSNQIQNNGGDGVDVDGAIIGAIIKQNAISSNGGLGIELHASVIDAGATPNDTGDPDNGTGNHSQNFPVVTSAILDGPTVTATLSLEFNVDSSTVGTTGGFRVEAFEADTDPTNPEGKRFMQGQCYSGNTLTNATMTIPTAGLTPGSKVVLTATSYTSGTCTTVNEGTSEFSFPGTTVTLQPGIVVNTNDSGTGSLRQAIADANSGACTSPCAITFNIPNTDPNFAGGVFTIRPTTNLPDILASNTTLDGATQTAFTGDTNVNGPEVVINGSLAGPTGRGLQIAAIVTGQGNNIAIRNVVVNAFSNEGIFLDGSSLPLTNISILLNYVGTDPSGTSAVANGTTGVYVSGLVSGAFIGASAQGNLISGNLQNGIVIDGANGNFVQGNVVGLNASGSAAIANGFVGIVIAGGSQGNTIGGTAGALNVVSGNLRQGIAILDSATDNNVVHGNYIGTNAAGTAAIGNSWAGVGIWNGAQNNAIGGTAPGQGNVISGNGEDGVAIRDLNTSLNTVAGNYVGTDSGGSFAVANGWYGVDIFSAATSNTVGGSIVSATNVISGNTLGGVLLSDSGTTGNVIGANRIGLNAAGSGALANAGPGVVIANAASGNTLGGSTVAANAIAHNGAAGVAITGATSIENNIRYNSIFSNTGLGIDLANNGVTANDAGDADSGPNALQNFPLLTMASYNSGMNQTTISGTLNSLPSTQFDIDWYSNAAIDGSGHGEGQVYEATSTFTTDALGNTVVSIVLTGNRRTSNIVATASRVNGPIRETSEFSAAAPNNPPVANNDAPATNEDTPLTFDPRTNDSDPEGGTFTITSNTQPSPSAGAVTCSATSCTFTPVADYNGPASFNYTITDDLGATATATVNITVNSVNDPPVANPDTITTSEDTPGAVNVLTNDTDTDGPSALSVTGNTNGTKGTVVCTAAGSCTYTPNLNQTGADSFTYTLSDGIATSAGTVNVNIGAVNDPPVANPDALATNEDTANTINVLTNDTDADGPSTLTVTGSTNGTKGSVVCTAAGACTYTPNLNQNGTDSFSYTVSDGGASSVGTVNVNITAVNDPPVANADVLATNANTPGSINVLVNDTDVDGPSTLTVTGSTNGTKGTVTCTAAGNCTYTPNLNESGLDSFTYTVFDGVSSATGTVSVTIGATNSPPNAADDFAETLQDTAVAIDVLSNDSDPDGDPLTLVASSQPANGSVTCQPDGNCTYAPNSGFTGVDSFTYTVQDTAGATSNATVTIDVFGCPEAPTAVTPAPDATGVRTTGRLFWNDTDAASYDVYLGRADDGGCNTRFRLSLLPAVQYSGLEPNTRYLWRVDVIRPGCQAASSACFAFTTAPNCNVALVLVKPLGGTATSPIEFEWQAVGGATQYTVFAKIGGDNFTELGTTTSTKLTASLVSDGSLQWFVVAVIPGCGNVQSPVATVDLCNRPGTPLARVVGQATSGQLYRVEWDAVPNAIRYEVDESSNADFIDATAISTTDLSVPIRHVLTAGAQAFHYRVRAFTSCSPAPGGNSLAIRIVIIPISSPGEPNPSTNVPAGSTEVVVQTVFIPGQPGQNLFFTATTDRPWLSVRPEMGALTPDGINLEVSADPKTLPNGTFTASIIVTITDTSSSGRIGTNGTSVSTTPFSINLVTPVTPIASKPAAAQYSLVIPTAGHVDGVNSHWQSDIRVTNAGFKSGRYQLTFTPSGGTSQGVKQTNITVDAGATTALDDIVRNWFGLGTLNDGSLGMLEILPLDDPATTSLSTVASSRTYSVSGNGTLGQYIPAVPFPSFIGKALPNALPQVLSLQQIAQSAAYRTNVGLAEAGSASVNSVLSVFNAGGSKLADIPVALAAGQQLQMNQFLKTHNIELADGRIEVKVTGGDGKITAYASVVDNATQDPLLVSGTSLSGTGATKFVLPGVANLDTSVAHWRTDMRVFNYGTIPQPATLTFFPFNNGPSKTAQVLLGAGQVVTLDNVLKTQFATENDGGVVHLSTEQPASLVVTGRTYNQTDQGTFGQFVPAVTVDQAVGVNERTLHILQVEDSTRYRTNVGLAEVSGKAVTVELQVVLPDSKITPTVQIPLAANEFRQFNVIRELGVGNVYNGRITVRVIDGQGRVTAYGSVIDEVTQDPTYVPAQ